MLVKICPFCDSEMKKAHYCDACRSFVWKPQEMDVHFNAKARGKGEVDCAYDEVHDTPRHDAPRHDTPRHDTPKPKTSMLRRIIVTFVAMLTVMEMLGAFLVNRIENIIPEIREYIPEVVVDFLDGDDSHEAWEREAGVEIEIESMMDEGMSSGEMENYSYESIDDAQLAAYADGCDQYDHFDVLISELRPQVMQWMHDYAKKSDSGNVYSAATSHNYMYTLDGEPHTVLDSYDYYYIDNEMITTAEIDFDSGSEKIHGLGLSGVCREDAEAFLEYFVPLLTGDASDWSEEAQAELFENEEDGYFETDNVSVFTYQDDEGENGTLWSAHIYPIP